jgi:hypothetical protein
MSTDDPTHDLPSDDEPDDDAIIRDAMEPDPAEVVGDDDSPRDLAAHRINDPNVRESLDERLSEEEPDRPVRRKPRDAVQVIGDDDGDDIDADETESDDDEDEDDQSDLGAEEAAVHIEDAFR